MSPGNSQDEQVKIAKSSAVATWVGVLIAATGLLVSIVAVYINRPRKPEPPSATNAQPTKSAALAPARPELKVQREGDPISRTAATPVQASKAKSSTQLQTTSAALRHRTKRNRQKAR